MTTKYVVAPLIPPTDAFWENDDLMSLNAEVGLSMIRIAMLYDAMLAAIPDDPAAPIPVGRDEWGRIKRDAERWRKWQDRRKEHIIAKERGT